MRCRSKFPDTVLSVMIASIMVLSALFLCTLFPTCLHGQTTGRIEGYVRDAETGEPLAGALVAVEGTGLSNMTVDDGYFFVPGLPPGPADITVRLIGYRPVTVEGRMIPADGTSTFDIALSSVIVDVGQRAPVRVEGEGELLILAEHSPSTYRETEEEILALPADNYRDIVVLEAGTVKFDDASNALYPISVRGGRPSENAVFVDGVNTRLYMTDQNVFDIPEVGTEEIDVMTGSAGYQYGEAQSGIINVVSRQGGRDYSGRVRFETDELAPAGSNYGFNRLQVSLGGPTPRLGDRLTFFFSGELTGRGDMHPRADGFKGRYSDIEWLAGEYSFDSLAREYLGHDLDIGALLNKAKAHHPDMQILHIDDYRTDGGEYIGRVIGNEGDETRFQMKLSYRPFWGGRLTGSLMTNRDQGMVFNPGMLFWEDYGNGIFRNESTLGIVDYTYTLGRSDDQWTDVRLRGSFQKSSQVIGPRFNLDDNDPRFGEDLGFGDITNVLNYRAGDIPIFLENLDGGDVDSLYDVLHNYQYDFALPTTRNGQNPFGLSALGFLDADVGYYNYIGTLHENRVDMRLDVESQLGRMHRVRSGLDLTYWDIDRYSNNLTSSTYLDFYTAEPNMISFYVEDRVRFQDFLIDLGLRVDSFYAGIEYPSILGDQDSERVKAERKTEAAPRCSIAHPLSDRFMVRAAYGIAYQVPQFTHLYEHINVDITEQQNTNQFFGNPALDMRKTTSFEVGLTALLLHDWIIELVGYNKDYSGNTAVRYLKQDDGPYLRIYTNDASGSARGLDTTLRKRLSRYFSTEFTYSLCYTHATDTDPSNFVINQGFFIGGGMPPMPPITESPTDFDQRHTISDRLNVKLPSDCREGTLSGSILKNIDIYFTALISSGLPRTPQKSYFQFVSEQYIQKTGWEATANLCIVKSFDWGGLQYGVFVDIRNLMGTKNLSAYQSASVSSGAVTNGVYQITGSPYSDGQTVRRAIDDIGIDDPSLYVGPRRTDINGDGVFNALDDEEIVRRLDFSGDGKVTVEEELAMRILGHAASEAKPFHFDIPRMIRFGMEVSF